MNKNKIVYTQCNMYASKWQLEGAVIWEVELTKIISKCEGQRKIPLFLPDIVTQGKVGISFLRVNGNPDYTSKCNFFLLENLVIIFCIIFFCLLIVNM